MKRKSPSIIPPVLILANILIWITILIFNAHGEKNEKNSFSETNDVWECNSSWLNSLGIYTDVYFIDQQNGWMTCNSAIIHTNGYSWECQFYDPDLSLVSIQFSDIYNGWVAGSIRINDLKEEGIILHTKDGGKHWNEQHQFAWKIYTLRFITEHDGWAVGSVRNDDNSYNSVILSTNDSGEHWSVQYEGINESLDSKISFIDLSNGWVLGSTKESNETKMFLLHTTDGGKNWAHIFLENEFIRTIHFVNVKEGWAVGTSSGEEKNTQQWTIFHTQDGGQTWAKQNIGIGRVSRKPLIYFVSENEGWIAVCSTILHTNDGGVTWSVQEYKLVIKDQEVDLYPFSMFFLDDQHGWIMGGGILETTNGGITWTQKTSKPFGSWNMNDIIFVSSNSGWAVGENGFIFHTVDEGQAWRMQDSKVSVNLSAIYFVSTQEGWIVGAGGTVLHTTDGGSSWEKQESGTQYDLCDVQFVNSQEGWIVGGNHTELVFGGVVLHTIDDGKHWETVKNIPRGDSCWHSNVQFIDSQTGWIIGITVLYTDDSGKTWKEQLSGNKILGPYYTTYFLDAMTGWMTGHGTIIDGIAAPWESIEHTTDGGINWELQYGEGKERFEAIYFANINEGWAFGNGILHTTDGGKTWVASKISGEPTIPIIDRINSVCYGGLGTLWAVGESGILLKYTDSNLQSIPPSYWAVESSGKAVTSWGEIKGHEQLSTPALSNELLQNYPNPFNPDTWMPYQLAKGGRVTITIYNTNGYMVRILDLGYKEAGSYITKDKAAYWDGRNNEGEKVASGLYFYQLKAGDFLAMKRMILEQ